jgi:hypothetical protein
MGIVQFSKVTRAEFQALLAEVAKLTQSTQADITYYVRKDGSDSNDGSANDAAHAFLTIQKAISVVPQIINHTVNIKVAAGTYAETVTVTSYLGKGKLVLTGDAVTPTNCKVLNCIIQNITQISVDINGFEFTSTTDSAVAIKYANYVSLYNCVSTSNVITPQKFGVDVSQMSGVYINACTMSNKYQALGCGYGSQLYSNTNTGTGNTIGLLAYGGGRISKNAGQPGGTTAESSNTGGTIA